MTNPTVSVIVPAFNCGKFISETLNSIIGQTYTDWECIVVDDGSTDETFEVVQGYCSQDSRIKCIKQENMRLPMARNNAIAHSSGKYILPVDADDKIADIYIEKAVEWFEKYPRTTLVYGRVAPMGNEKESIYYPPYKYEDLIWNNSIICSAMYRRSDYNLTNGYNPNMKEGFEDWDFWLSLLNKESIVHRLDEIVYYLRIRDNSLSANTRKHRTALHQQIIQNHPEIYAPFFTDIISLHQQMIVQNEEISRLIKEIRRIQSSRAYKIGKLMLTPFSNIRQFICRFSKNTSS